ncbi:uncharacterized protein [Ptychodera flava]|uniref:uncharacterized protein n=1 Tax=Ptychodera flava TaxID=63121 RepID=UPI00396A8FF9
MKLCLVITSFFLGLLVNGFTDGNDHVHDVLEKLGLPSGRSMDNESAGLLRVLLSGRVPVSMSRAMMFRYFQKRGLHTPVLPILRGLHGQEDFAMTLVMFNQIQKGLEKALLDKRKAVQDDRVYLFQAEPLLNSSIYYLDNTETKGFFPDLVEEVCKEAGKKCLLTYDTYDRCHTSDLQGYDYEGAGRGLLGKYYDGCLLSANSELANAVAFSDMLIGYSSPSRYFVPTGNPGNFNPNDISGRNIGFIIGWESNFRCLRENNVVGSRLKGPHQIFVQDTQKLIKSFRNQKIDAAFVALNPEYGTEEEDLSMFGGTPVGLEPVGDVWHCGDGMALATRKDSQVLKWFNATLRKMKKSGKYAEVCRKARIEHGHMGETECLFEMELVNEK